MAGMVIKSQAPCIAPGFGLEHTFYWSSQFGIWVREGNGFFDVRWKVGRYLYDGLSENNFMVRLYADGRFEMRYGPIENIGFDYTLYRGVSKGDEINFWATAVPRFDDMEGKAYFYYPPEVPSGISLTREGILSVDKPDTTILYSIPVKVTDKQKISDLRTFGFSDGLSISWDAGVTAAFNTEVPVNLTLKNTGSVPLNNLVLTFITGSEALGFTDTTTTITLLEPGSKITLLPAFSMVLKEHMDDQTTFLTTIRAEAGQRVWHQTMPVTVGAPTIRLVRTEVEDGYNNLLDPGEVADIFVTLANQGSKDAQSLNLVLEPADTLVIIESDPLYMQDQFTKDQSIRIPFRLKASQYTKPGQSASLRVLIGQDGYPQDTIPFDLTIGNTPVAMISFAANDATHTMEMLLDSLDVPYEKWDTIPKLNLRNYPNLFLFLGATNAVSSDLTDQQGDFFSNYLEAGNNLYLESYRFWGLSVPTSLNDKFWYTSESVPVYDYFAMRGVPGTLTDSMHFYHSFPGSQASYRIIPGEDQIPLFVTDNLSKYVTTFADSTNNYRTIATMAGFEYLLGGIEPSSRITLLKRYLEFFGYNFEQLFPLFHADKRVLQKNDTVRFTDDSFRDVISWKWEFAGGTPTLSEEKDPRISYSSPGLFDVTLTVSNGVHERSITKKNYIQVSFPEGTEDTTPEQSFLCFPNPVKDVLFLKSMANISETLTLNFFDLYGRSVYSQKIPGARFGETYVLNVAGLKQGFYVVRISGENYRQLTKVIKTN